MQTGDFFNQINFAFNIEAPAGNVYEIGVLIARDHDEAEAGQDAADLVVADFFAEDTFYLPAIEFDGCLIELARDHVDDGTDEFTASRLEDEFGYAIG